MAKKLAAPSNVTVQPRDRAVYVNWSAVDGADGYIIHFYKESAPEKCIKKRYAQGTAKQLFGFENGTKYLAAVSAFCYEKGAEREGEASDKAGFVPISETLKAQKIICIPLGETGQMKWECRNKSPMAYFSSDNEAVSTVGNGGMIHAHSAGVAHITVSADNQKFTTKVYVDRKRPQADTKAVMMFTGDLMCAVAHQRIAEKRNFDFGGSFDAVRDIFTAADLSVGVLETTCCDGAPYEYEELRLESGAPNCNSPSSFVTAAAHAGFDVMVTANNHNRDTAYIGLSQTVQHIRRQGMANVGTLGDGFIMRDVKGIKVALIACTMAANRQKYNDPKFDDERVWGKYSRDYFTALVDEAKKSGAEYIVAYQHWGMMNSRGIVSSQRDEAQFMADSGADIIIGSHPHVLQEMRYLISSDGRVVPCAFSLGNFLSTQAELVENRDSAIVRVELTRDADGISAAVSAIPCHCFDTRDGVTVRPVYPSYSEDSREALKRINDCIGKSVKPYAKKPKVVLSGSVILERIFGSESGFEVDKAPVLLSQLSACTGSGEPYDIVGTVRLDVEKSFAQHIRSCGADMIAVDLYSAAAISCYQMGDNLYTGSKKFLNSKFYKKNQSRMKRIRPPFSAKLWKPCVKRYAEAVLAAFPPERIVLFRQCFSEKAATGAELRLSEPRDDLNRRIAEMEDYFISLVQPAVVDISRCYFSIGSSPSDIEREYFSDAANAAARILTQGRAYIDRADTDMWYDRVLRYYNSMTARGFQRWLLNMRSAADMLIAYTNENFAARHRQRLLRLKRLGCSELSEVRGFFAQDCGAEEIANAADLIDRVLRGDLSQDYDCYAPAFREKYNILKIMAKLLSVELEAPITSEAAELAFLLRDKPQQLKQYITKLREITVDVWGSTLSKSVLDRCKNARVGRYVFGQCPLLANEPLVPASIPQDDTKFSGNSWRRRMTEEAFSRMGMFSLTKSGSKWLVVDFYDAVNQMNELGGGLFVVDEFLKNTEFYKEIKDQCTPCYLFEKRTMAQCQSALKRFTEDLSFRYGKNIILIKTDLKDRYITLGDRLEALPADQYLDVKRRFLALCEGYFVDYTGCFVLDISKHYHAADRHPEGAGDVNYEADFYRRAAEYVSYVVNGGTTRLFNRADESYIRMRDLRLDRK